MDTQNTRERYALQCDYRSKPTIDLTSPLLALNKAKGLSMRKTCAVLHDCFGLQLSAALEHNAVQLLEPARSEPNKEAVRNRLNKQRDHLFTFLHHDGVDATNNLAERQLRPAVIARKISCANKTIKGAQTWQILASLAATCTQRATSFIGALARAAPLQAR